MSSSKLALAWQKGHNILCTFTMLILYSPPVVISVMHNYGNGKKIGTDGKHNSAIFSQL